MELKSTQTASTSTSASAPRSFDRNSNDGVLPKLAPPALMQKFLLNQDIGALEADVRAHLNALTGDSYTGPLANWPCSLYPAEQRSIAEGELAFTEDELSDLHRKILTASYGTRIDAGQECQAYVLNFEDYVLLHRGLAICVANVWEKNPFLLPDAPVDGVVLTRSALSIQSMDYEQSDPDEVELVIRMPGIATRCYIRAAHYNGLSGLLWLGVSRSRVFTMDPEATAWLRSELLARFGAISN